jgi:hypothetical protein
MLFLFLNGCDLSDDDSDIDKYNKTVYIDHFESACTVIPIVGLRLRNRYNEESEWSSEIDYIKHFDYEWGIDIHYLCMWKRILEMLLG